MQKDINIAERRPEFNLDYWSAKNGKFRKLSRQEKAHFDKKCEYFSKMTVSDFEQGVTRPRIWHEELPCGLPAGLSQDICDTPYRIDFGRKMRVFAFKYENVYFVLCVDPAHKSG